MGIALLHPGAAAEEEEGAPSNLRTFQLLSGQIADSAASVFPHGDSVKVDLAMHPQGSAWIVEGPVIQSWQSHRLTVVAGPPATYTADVGVQEMRVTYSGIRRTGFFGTRVVDREVAVELQVKIVDGRSGAILMSRAIRNVARDTVGVSEIQQLEDPNVPATHAPLPSEGFFSSFAEPIVMLGAIAVAVYLLFTVRS